MKSKLLTGWALTLLATTSMVSCGDDEGDDGGQPSGGKAAAGTAGSSSAGKSGSSGSGGKAGSAGSSSGAAGSSAGTAGAAGKAGSGGTGGGAGTGSSGDGGESGEAGGGGEGGDGGEGALGGMGGQAGESGQGGQAGETGGSSGTGGGGTSGGGTGGNGGTSGGGTSGTAGGGTAAEAGVGGEGGGSAVATARLRLNELNSNLANGQDLIELRVIEGGNIAGITIEQTIMTPVVLATLPSLVVATDDLVVVHLNAPGGVTSEMLAKDQCAGQACFDEAWDVRGNDTGLFYGNRVISVMDGDTYQDAVPFVVDGNEPPAFLAALTAIQDAGQWLPVNCGGDDCTYDTAPSADAISVDWSDLETTAAGDSIQVTGANNNQESAWEIAASTWGEPND